MGELTAMQCDDCDEEAGTEHHVTWARGKVPPFAGDEMHHHCGKHHSVCVAALDAVPIDHPSRYAMQWTRSMTRPRTPADDEPK